jgi:hypothetical protein
MTGERNLREELLQQNGGSSPEGRDLRDAILAKDQTRVKRMKWVAAISWVVFLLFFAASVFFEVMRRHSQRIMGVSAREIAGFFPEYDWLVPAAILVTQALFILAVVMTFSLHTRSRTLTMHQIQASLAQIEEHLKKMAEKE